MAELYNKVGLGLITWSPVSLGLLLGNREEQIQLCVKLAVKVTIRYKLLTYSNWNLESKKFGVFYHFQRK